MIQQLVLEGLGYGLALGLILSVIGFAMAAGVVIALRLFKVVK